MTNRNIEAIGNFLAAYETDLIYIRNFQRHREGKINIETYVEKKVGMFYQFLIEFRVTRNFDGGKSKELLLQTIKWLDNNQNNDVDGFASFLKTNGLTRNGTMTSLASKILFLNNPWKVLPMDNLAKEALNHKNDNLYKNYLPKVMEYKAKMRELIDDTLTFIKPYIIIIEADFKNELNEIQSIRENRLIDKLLWTDGRNINLKNILK